MGTVRELIAVAMSDLGYKEVPANSNYTKYGEWMGLQYQPWCMSAVQYWANVANVVLPLKTGSCTSLMNAAKQSGQWVTSCYKEGDIPIYQFKSGKHCGIITEVQPDYVMSIEGNTAVGNDSNGGEVMLRQRSYENILGAVRPKFDAVAEGGVISYDSFVALFNQHRSTLRDNDSSSYSSDARKWAVDNGIILGNGTIEEQPNYMWQDFLTREQFVTMLYRYHMMQQ